jgi:dUTP pyrophosphatase
MDLKVKIVNRSNNPLPEYGTQYSSGVDLRADIQEDIILQSLERKLIPTGIFIEIPNGYEAQIRPRSGLAIKKGLSVVNSPGTIDADYRGEIKVIVINLSNEDIIIQKGERICQMVFSKVEKVEWQCVDKINDTVRGHGGFGHTGGN